MNTEELTKMMSNILMDFENKQACNLDPFQGYGFEQALDDELIEDDEFFGIPDFLTYELVHGIETYSMHDESCGMHIR